MANCKSAKKRIRSSKKRSQINRRIRSTIRTFEKSLRKSLENKESNKETNKDISKFFSLLDKARLKGVYKGNTVDRKKSRFASKFHQIQN